MSQTPAKQDPIKLFENWLLDAEKSEPNDPTAMTLATVNAAGMPQARMVLLKGVDAEGFVFYTNLGSDKAKDLSSNPVAALVFHWKSLRKQVRISGSVEPVSEAEADEYFASRPRDSRIGAWASKQSQPLEGMFELEVRVAKFVAKYAVGDIPRPEFWSGFRIKPKTIEFWSDRPFRLHEREVYNKTKNGWSVQRIYP
ncbi:MAG: pyridoxamine 5'-phosphate oxidase [Rhodospirillaceae bacterium]|nr:pyridoxamine 5'-phosphate oxidase [Rhodospirillaceae bacterium]